MAQPRSTRPRVAPRPTTAMYAGKHVRGTLPRSTVHRRGTEAIDLYCSTEKSNTEIDAAEDDDSEPPSKRRKAARRSTTTAATTSTTPLTQSGVSTRLTTATAGPSTPLFVRPGVATRSNTSAAEPRSESFAAVADEDSPSHPKRRTAAKGPTATPAIPPTRQLPPRSAKDAMKGKEYIKDHPPKSR